MRAMIVGDADRTRKSARVRPLGCFDRRASRWLWRRTQDDAINQQRGVLRNAGSRAALPRLATPRQSTCRSSGRGMDRELRARHLHRPRGHGVRRRRHRDRIELRVRAGRRVDRCEVPVGPRPPGLRSSSCQRERSLQSRRAARRTTRAADWYCRRIRPKPPHLPHAWLLAGDRTVRTRASHLRNKSRRQGWRVKGRQGVRILRPGSSHSPTLNEAMSRPAAPDVAAVNPSRRSPATGRQWRRATTRRAIVR
jgi:hypothetical protein